jgi:hypothetical protein
VRDFLQEGDDATGTSVLTELHERFARRGEPVDVARELERAKRLVPAKP